MSNRLFGFYFSGNADASANDYTMYVEMRSNGGTVKVGARYKSAERNGLYEMEMDEDDLRLFGEMCLDLSMRMKTDQELSKRMTKGR